jgi:hypothetical protein
MEVDEVKYILAWKDPASKSGRRGDQARRDWSPKSKTREWSFGNIVKARVCK